MSKHFPGRLLNFSMQTELSLDLSFWSHVFVSCCMWIFQVRWHGPGSFCSLLEREVVPVPLSFPKLTPVPSGHATVGEWGTGDHAEWRYYWCSAPDWVKLKLTTASAAETLSFTCTNDQTEEIHIAEGYCSPLNCQSKRIISGFSLSSQKIKSSSLGCYEQLW